MEMKMKMEKKVEEEGPPIGIDLGTSYSCVGVWERNHVHIIPNPDGNRTTPSWVAFTRSQVVVGKAAKDQVGINPQNTIYDAKRLMGMEFSVDNVQLSIERKCWPFKVINGENDRPKILVSYKGEDKQFSPEQISSMVLRKMKHIAEEYLRKTVKDVVITVPAYFNNSQRQATIDAGKIAELNVLRIINEPTAAAMAYASVRIIDENNSATSNILIFDLGGGTFDVSLVTITNDSFIVKGVEGDTYLGGGDFDNRMVDYYLDVFKKKHNLDIRSHPRALAKLRTRCEQAKRTLSSVTETQISIDSLYKDIDFECWLQRGKFEMLNEDLFQKCIGLVDKCLTNAKMNKSDVDEVVLVGGSSRIPRVQKLLQDFFPGKKLCKSLNADEAVACGAAIQAALLSGLRNDKHKLVDVTPLSLGIMVASGKMDVVISGNTRIPTTHEIKYITSNDDQTKIEIVVYEGECPMAKENHFLGNFFLSGITPLPKGAVTVTVVFKIDENSILTVSAEEESTKERSQITITQHRGNLLENQINWMKEEARKYEREPVHKMELED